MRMWSADPRGMCRKHLLGEHVEMHMFVGHLKLHRALGKYASMCEPEKIEKRHRALAREMLRRGYFHKSPLEFEYQGSEKGSIDKRASLDELLRRCAECRALHEQLPAKSAKKQPASRATTPLRKRSKSA